MKIKKLNWDSTFFKFKIGTIKIKEFDNNLLDNLIKISKKSAYKLVYIYPLDEISKKVLLIKNIPLVDTKVTFNKKDFTISPKSSNVHSFNKHDDFNKILKLAILSGEYSRFRQDKNFVKNEFLNLYTEWIKKSINKDIATDVIIYKENNEILGFVSYTITSSNKIIIGLIAVEKQQHGKGIGKILLKSIENIAIELKLKEIIVSTQFDNTQAMAFYNSNNFQIKEIKEIYHLWIQ